MGPVGASVPRRQRLSIASRALIAAVILYVAALVVAPIVALAGRAFAEGPAAAGRALIHPEFLESFRLSLFVSLVVVLLQLVLGTIAAWVLERHEFRGKEWLNSAVDLPFALSPVVVGYMLLLLFGRSGVLNPLLRLLDGRIAFAVPGLILATLFVTLPFMIRELGPVIRALDVRQEQAAATLGAGGWTTFRRVILPALRTALAYGMALTLARSLGEFGAVLVIGGGIQGRTETATLYIFRALEERHYVEAYTAALALGLVSVVLVTLADRLRRRED